jgi:hypothetical protein
MGSYLRHRRLSWWPNRLMSLNRLMLRSQRSVKSESAISALLFPEK